VGKQIALGLAEFPASPASSADRHLIVPTGVVFQFNAGDDVVQLGDGTLDVSIAVNDGAGCPMGTVNCGGACVDLNNDPTNCGACARSA